MSALALAFKRKGHEKLPDGRLVPSWKVTGSDVGFYPPVSTYLKEAGVDYYAGWHAEKMIVDGIPDLVVVGNVASSHNPEWLYVQDHKLNYKSYPEVIAEHFIKKNSIVCAGTFGKTTSTALLTWILKEAGYNPSYMFGGVSLNNIPAAELTNGAWSVLEGDEYIASRWDKGPKFNYYSTTHLLLTSVVWDHADVYPTEVSYIEAFRKLVATVPESGLKVISEKAAPVVANPPSRGAHGGCKTVAWPDTTGRVGNTKDSHPHYPPRGGVITYGREPYNNYVYTNIVQSKNGITFDIIHEHKKYSLATSCLGDYMADNITGCFALAHQIGISPEKIIGAVASFKSLKRRLEKRYEGVITIFDDIAHSPSKAQAILKTLYEVYATRPLSNLSFAKERGTTPPRLRRGEVGERSRIIAIFEPNTGNRQTQAIPQYDNAFKNADEVIVPRLTKIKSTIGSDGHFEGNQLVQIISKTHPAAIYLDADEELVKYVLKKIQPGDVVVFMGSHGFRGMIENLVYKVKSL